MINLAVLLLIAPSCLAVTPIDETLSMFANPPKVYRPRFRYWLPSGRVNPTTVGNDVREMSAKGWGGAEFLDFAAYGGNDTFADPTTYSWTSSSVLDAADAFFKAGAETGMQLDWTQSPNQGQGVPLFTANDEGSSMELARGTIVVTSGSTYTGKPPPPINPAAPGITNQQLIAVVSAKLISPSSNPSIPSGVTPTPVLIDFSSLQVITPDSTGNVTIKATGADYLTFAFWQRSTGHASALGGFNGARASSPNTWTTWEADHFSSSGANAIIQANQKYIEPRLGAAWKNSGKYLWEDSVEIQTNEIFWSPDFINRFKTGRGFDVTPYLPFLYVNGSATSISSAHFGANSASLFEAGDAAGAKMTSKIRADYYQQLSTGYTEYVDTLAKYARSVGLEYSAQLGYGLPVDVQAAVAKVDTPEIETLAFQGNITGYRTVSGAQHLSKAKVMSSEAGAIFGQAYQTTWPRWLQQFHSSYAGGVNQIVMHGFPYSGNYSEFPKTPGYEAWFYIFSEAQGPRQPSWNYNNYISDSLGRAQTILYTGQPCMDIVVYRLSYKDDNFFTGFHYTPIRPLSDAGYSYEFASPAVLALPSTSVVDGHLSPEGGPGYQALVLDGYGDVTIPALKQIASFAKAGLAVFFVGPLPTSGAYFGESDADVQALIKTILTLPMVTQVADEAALILAMQKRGIIPAAQHVGGNADVYTMKRYDPKTAVDYYYTFNSGINTTTATLSLENHKKQKPYYLNTWTGDITPIVTYSQTADRLVLNITLQPNDYRIITLGDAIPIAAPSYSVATNLSLSYTDGKLVAKVTDNSTHVLQLSTGRNVTIQAKNVPAAMTLSNWDLEAKSWGALPANSSTTGHSTTGISLKNISSTLWSANKVLTNSSGTGVYTTSFSLSSSFGAYLDLGSCYHTCNASINGIPTAAINPLSPRVDISKLLKNGINTVAIEVSTPLGNFLRLLAVSPYNDILANGTGSAYSSGIGAFTPPFIALSAYDANYGLVAPVRILPYSAQTVV